MTETKTETETKTKIMASQARRALPPLQASDSARVCATARRFGFEEAGIATAELDSRAQARMRELVATKQHGTMAWFARTLERRLSPKILWQDAQSAIVLAASYAPDEDPFLVLADKQRAAIACYAQGDDYHDLLKKRLKRFARWLAAQYHSEVKVFVDTAPLSEKTLAAHSGLGWQGKNTQLVSRRWGCWLFLAVVLCDRAFPSSKPQPDACGSCRRCLNACPTNAFPKPYQLDARKCLSYLTIEHRGAIPRRFRALLGNRIFGCDDCLAVCPWNKFAQKTREIAFLPRDEIQSATLKDFLQLDEAQFRARFRKNPVKRLGFARFQRNVLIAVGNSGDKTFLPTLEARVSGGEDAVVRGAAVWAYARLSESASFLERASQFLTQEKERSVQAEWRAGLKAHSKRS